MSKLIISLFVTLMVVWSGGKVQAKDDGYRGYTFMGFPFGTGSQLIRPPSITRLGMLSGAPDKRDTIFSVLKLVTLAGNGALVPTGELKDDFVAVAFGPKIISSQGVDTTQLGFLQKDDAATFSILTKESTQGKNCISATIYSEQGSFNRALIIANEDASNVELSDCALEVGAHMYGINVARVPLDIPFETRLSDVASMIKASQSCFAADQATLECANGRLPKK